MTDRLFSFNVAKGKIRYYTELPGVNDGLVVVLLESAGLEPDATLKDYDTLADLLAGPNNEQVTMGRKALTNAVVEPDDVNEWVDYNGDDQMWEQAAGNPVAALLICYDPDTTASSDANIIPLTCHPFSVAPNGNDTVMMIAVEGFARTRDAVTA